MRSLRSKMLMTILVPMIVLLAGVALIVYFQINQELKILMGSSAQEVVEKSVSSKA